MTLISGHCTTYLTVEWNSLSPYKKNFQSLWLQFKTELQLKCREAEDEWKGLRDAEENIPGKLVQIVSSLKGVDDQVQALRKEVNEKMTDLQISVKHLSNQRVQFDTAAPPMTSFPEEVMEEVGGDREERNLNQTQTDRKRSGSSLDEDNTYFSSMNDATVDRRSWLSLNLRTVQDVWQAYHEGIRPIPPIKDLEKNKKKDNWRKGKCGQFYDWSVIWQDITERSKREARTLASILNELMQKQENNAWSLREISSYIQSKRPNSKSSKAARALNNGNIQERL